MVAQKKTDFQGNNNYLQLSTITIYNHLQLPYNRYTINGWAQAFRVTGAFMGLVPLPGAAQNHLDSCQRTMSYVRRTTSYNTDVAHDVVRHARTTSYPYDVVARTTSQPYDVVCLYDIVGLTYDIVCCHRIRHRMF